MESLFTLTGTISSSLMIGVSMTIVLLWNHIKDQEDAEYYNYWLEAQFVSIVWLLCSLLYWMFTPTLKKAFLSTCVFLYFAIHFSLFIFWCVVFTKYPDPFYMLKIFIELAIVILLCCSKFFKRDNLNEENLKFIHLSSFAHLFNLGYNIFFFTFFMLFFWNERFNHVRAKEFCGSEAVDCGAVLTMIGVMAIFVFCGAMMMDIYLLMGVVLCLNPYKKKMVDVLTENKDDNSSEINAKTV